MLSWKKSSADISEEAPTFQVRYIGTTETFVPVGQGCATQPLQRLWDNAPSEKNLHKVLVKLSSHGIHMDELDKKNNKDVPHRWFSIEDISFCAADKNVNDRLFCWITKDPNSGKLEVHAVLCSSQEKARTMASVLSRQFHLAYKDWMAERQREKRKEATSSMTCLDDKHGRAFQGCFFPTKREAVILLKKNPSYGAEKTEDQTTFESQKN
ncbi:unnamed protein product [Candidula unifasciata]|uniref:PID domain-containing protein n=1 Tax=Candidula unifasciata TaxID=100452 RepID=A0A8S3YJJ8_9EUPU|nr:unnamed protein product [Candidula unifasciata]